MSLANFLDKLKLNSYEKEIIVYLALVDNSNAHTIYKNVRVPKGRIYSVLQELIEKNIVKIIPTSPKKYEIRNVKKTLKEYLTRKQTELEKKKEEVEELELEPKKFLLDKKAPSVNLFTGREEHLEAATSLREHAKKEILQIAPLFIGTFASNLSLYKALKRGVKAKAIIPAVTDKNRKKTKEALKHGCEVRISESEKMMSMLIIDSEEFLLGVNRHGHQEERLTIYSRNKAILETMKETFLKLWEEAKPISKKELD
ncbi:hypothetical protein HQ533_06125 [Candidatus Woesearchaeota archaeon]|nr:hypothetical protein [Candidatus Woesearchaeota archaeon]